LNGSAAQVASIFRLDTNYGGGKTHALIALTYAAAGMPGVAQPIVDIAQLVAKSIIFRVL
jgi:hypothetical protein